MSYSELQVTTNFSFLRGGSHPEELVKQADDLGYKAIAITDRNTVAGVVRAHAAAKGKKIRVLPGCRLDLQDGPSLLALPMSREAWTGLCTLLSIGNDRVEKGDCRLSRTDVYAHCAGMQLIVLPPESLRSDFHFDPAFQAVLQEYRAQFGAALSLAATRRYGGDDGKQLYRLQQLALAFDVPLVATNDVYYHHPGRRQLQDVLTCIREKCTIREAGFRLLANAERHLKEIGEMQRLFLQYPAALARAEAIADACRFSLDQLRYEYPEEITTGGRTPQEELAMLAWAGARHSYGAVIPEKIRDAIEYELTFIEEKNYAAYFLTVHDIVRFARERGILCQGRGSAANSTVCFCLGVTSVDPQQIELLFERFLSAARDEPPDIDVDFEHERREEVIRYIYEKYGHGRAAIVATVTQVRGRTAIRDVGKVMGLSQDAVGRLAGTLHHYGMEAVEAADVKEQGMDPSEPVLRKTLELARQYVGFPRQLGQHTGGFVITRGRLAELCPVLKARMPGRTCIEWNKDDIEALGFLKIDVLALGMLTCIRKAFDLARQHYGLNLTLASVPKEDPVVYKMISAADTIGVFQIESRAQQSMLPRLKPENFYDLVIEVAIVRPGPIQGGMVHPYLRRRNGEEDEEYPSEELREILSRTKGVPLFQEQAMKIAIVGAGFTPAEADGLRRSMATFKAKGEVSQWQEKLVGGMIAKGYSKAYAERVFRQLEGFGSYGFPESHAASFALLVYVSSWLKCHYPDVFAAALLNSMPMGFYQPAQLVSDARNHGVEVRPADINLSDWDHTLEEQSGRYRALRLGFRQIKGLAAEDAAVLLAGRGQPYASINALRDAGVPEAALERLADADAFRSMGLDRRQALWELGAKDRPEALYAGQMPADAIGEEVALPKLLASEHVVQDYATTALSLKAHPVQFLRDKLRKCGIRPIGDLAQARNGQAVKLAGLVLVRQRPGTAKGVWFMTIEDETGLANLVIFPNLPPKFYKAMIAARLILVEGTIQVESSVIHVIVERCSDGTRLLRGLTEPSMFEKEDAGTKRDSVQQGKLFPEARNFK